MPGDDRDRISRFLKAELKRRNVTYEELARRLNELAATQQTGPIRAKLAGQETKASVANKLSRGQFSAIFFIDVLRAIGIERVDLQDI